MSAKPVEFHPEALAEAEAAVTWYRERSLRAAEFFVSEPETAVNTISEAPEWRPLLEFGARRFPLRRFPYFVVYREKAETIRVLAVAHGRRRPGYWRARKRVDRSSIVKKAPKD